MLEKLYKTFAALFFGSVFAGMIGGLYAIWLNTSQGMNIVYSSLVVGVPSGILAIFVAALEEELNETLSCAYCNTSFEIFELTGECAGSVFCPSCKSGVAKVEEVRK